MAAFDAATRRHPGLIWCTSTVPLRNGRYLVDFVRTVIWLDGHQDHTCAGPALLDAIAELDAARGIRGGVVIPMQRGRRCRIGHSRANRR